MVNDKFKKKEKSCKLLKMAEPITFSFGTQIQVNFSGNIYDAIVESFDGSILTLSVNGQSKSFIADLDSQSIYDTSGNHGFFYHGLPSMENIMSNPSTSVDEIDALVWRMIRGEVPTCQCPRCTLDHIRFLRLAAHSPPEPLNMNIILACVHIIDSMIPRMTDRIMGNLNELMAMIAGPNDILSQVLQASMADGPKRHAAKAEVVCSLDDRAHPYDSSHKCDTCTICMEKFSYIEAETKAPVMVITCPGCESSFCAGNVCEGEKKEDQCQGFKYLMQKYDNRCPICRMPVKDWPEVNPTPAETKDRSKVNATSVENTEETSTEVLPNFNNNLTLNFDMNSYSIFYNNNTSRYQYASSLSFDVSDSMSAEPILASIDMEIPDSEISGRRNRRQRRRGDRKKYPPIKLKIPYKNAYQKKRNVMRHNRQQYGR